MVVRRELISGLAATVGCMYVRDAPTQHMKCHAPLPVCLSAGFFRCRRPRSTRSGHRAASSGASAAARGTDRQKPHRWSVSLV